MFSKTSYSPIFPALLHNLKFTPSALTEHTLTIYSCLKSDQNQMADKYGSIEQNCLTELWVRI